MKKVLSLLLSALLISSLPTLFAHANPPSGDPPVITVSGNTNICYGSSTTLTASGALTYTWTSDLAIDGIASARLAVGLHKLKTSYAGFALQLRRSSDNTTMDFGFVGNDLDLASINTFLNGGSGFCSILYDQSGNGNNMTQPIVINQPLFVASGQNGKPVLHCSSLQYMQNPTNFNTPYTVVYAARQTGAPRERVLSSINNNWLLGWWGGYQNQAYFEGWISNPTTSADNNFAIYSGSGNGNSSSLYKNGSALVENSTAGTAGPNGLQMNGSGFFGEMSESEFLDLMVFNTVLPSTTRVFAESAIASYYNVAGAGSQVTVSPTSTTTYTVTGTDANGVSASTTVTVNVAPQHSISPAGTVVVCAGSSVTLTASTGSSYLWSTGAVTQSISVDTTGIFSVQVDNCPAANTVKTYLASVTPASGTLCSGNATLTASGPQNLLNYNWSGADAFDSYELSITPLANVISLQIAAGTTALVHSHSGVTVDFQVDLFNPDTQTWVNVYSSSTTGQFNFGGLALQFPTISHINAIRFTGAPAQNSSFHNFSGMAFSFTSSDNTFSYLWNTGATTQTIHATATGTYSVSIAGCPAVSATVSGVPGDTSVFGNNSWNVYAWNAGEANDTTHSWNTNYSGYYTSDSLNFDTENDWSMGGSPSDAPNYTGCPVNTDNHSWSAKRRGFDCSYYQIDISGHDDAAQLFVDGVKVWQHIGCCDTHENVWTGYLNSNSTIEFRTTEGGGGSFGSLQIIKKLQIDCPATTETTVNIPAGQCSAVVNLTAPTANDPCSAVTFSNDHPSTTFTAGTTYVTWTGVDASGTTGTCVVVVNVLEPVAPVINCPASVIVNSTPGICGAIVNMAPTATDNCPTTAIGSKVFNSTDSIQRFVVPAGVTAIKITAIGAAGGDAPNSIGGKGASMSGFFPVTPGETLYMVVGGKGMTSPDGSFSGGGGGGGTFVARDQQMINGLMIAAGGGGGAGAGGSSNANTSASGNNGGTGIGYGTAPGGTGGSGGGYYGAGSGGAGWLSSGAYGDCSNGGLAPRDGATGGEGLPCGGANGGYGGGGSGYYGGGGGGGYSGGGAGDYANDYSFGTYGGGGGSFNAGSSQVNTATVGTGDGKVIINYTISFPNITQTAGIPPGNIYPIGTTVNTWTVTDASGNTAICSASVSVLDKQAPVFNCPSNITSDVDAGQCTAVVNFSAPTITDNCCPTLSNAAYTYLGAFGTHTYYLSSQYTDWNSAHIAAVAAGGNLVSINSAAENNFLTTALNGTRVWLGGFQNHQNPNYSEPANGWEWVDGTQFTYTNWNPGEPNNSGGEDYAESFGGLWNDLPYFGYNPFVVEVSCGMSLTQIAGPVSGTAFPIGTTTITYKASDAVGNTSTCSFNVIVTDNANPGITVAPITGNGTICIGTPSQLADATTGGNWTSVNPTIATVDNSGLVTGVTAGDATIKYTVNLNGCDRVVYKQVSVYSVPVLTNAIITGITNVCPYVGTGLPLTYTITNAVSATGYTWTVPPTVTILSGQGTNSITVTINTGFVSGANKQIRVKGNSACGSSTDKIFYMAAQLPNTPQTMTGTTSICSLLGTGTATSYKIPVVPGASSYIWTIPANTSATHPNGPGAFDTIINVIYAAGFTSGNIAVQSVNDCGTSGLRSLAIIRTNPSTPGLISGPTNACPYMLPNGTAAAYFITPVPGAISYTWSAPAGAVVTHPHSGANDTIITVKFPANFTSGNITITATNGCGTSGTRSQAISKLNPGTPSVIDVIQTQFCPNRSYSYTLSTMPANATSVQWTVPANAIGFTGQGTTSIIVSYPDVAVQGTITATAVNNCGTSTVRSTAVRLPACPPPGFAKGNTQGNGNIAVTTPVTVIKENKITVMPNPSTSSFKLTVKSISEQKVQVTLLDASGRSIKNMTVQPNQSIDFGSELKSGVYLLQIEQGGQRRTERIVKL